MIKAISTIYKNIRNIKPTTVISVVFVVGGILFNVLFWSLSGSGIAGLGGPVLASVETIIGADYDSFLAENSISGDLDGAFHGQDVAGFLLLDSGSLLNSSNPLSSLLPTRDGLMVYKIQAGDTLSTIAANFEISLNTVLWANRDLSSVIRPGQEIVVLPVSGIAHQVQEGDTLEHIANLYSIGADRIIEVNPTIANGNLVTGTKIIIPGGRPNREYLSSLSDNTLVNLDGYFISPAVGWNWGRLHNYNAVDIANACGTPIYAAAEGLIVDESSYGWNSGYGHYIDIEHPNSVVTRYSHTQRNVVSVGDYVLQGDLIAYIGSTGNTHGPTGCHLHFEVRGARNPFAK
ncbi:MAG: M23 family metallopeptidase [bacterium]|nr:M23 family metallopeptidase [bacterium]